MDSNQSQLTAVLALYEAGLHQECLELACLELEKRPHDGKLWEVRGLAHDALGHRAESMKALETATTLVPLSLAGQCVLARCYAFVGHRELARNMYRHLFSLEPLPDRILAAVAAGLGSVGDSALALEACRRAAARELDSGQPFYGMAHYMVRLNYPLESVAAVLRRAIDVEPDRFQFRFALATACQQLGRLQEAYRVIRPVVNAERLRGIRCVHCVRRMEAIVTAAGDDELRAACRNRLAEMASIGQCDDERMIE